MKKNFIFIGENKTVMESSAFSKFKDNVDIIYIDPPYNNGSTFSYNNSAHSNNWLLAIKERLSLAKDLMTDAGVIFISIDDYEYANLIIACNEVFGKENFLGTFITNQAKRSNAKHINITHEYIVSFAKNKNNVKPFIIPRMTIPEDRDLIEKLQEEVHKNIKDKGIEYAQKELSKSIKKACLEYNITWLKNYSQIEENTGLIYFAKDLSTPGKPAPLVIEEIGLNLPALPTRGWSSARKILDLHKRNMLAYKNGRPYEKHYLKDANDNVHSILNFYSRQGTNDLNKLGLRDLFDTPKPVALIKFLIQIVSNGNALVLDFFAGSGTTAQAVYELNEENNQNNNYILIQQYENGSLTNKALETCKALNIEPNIPSIMIKRINTYLEQNGQSIDYTIIKT
ncbi:MAG: DNA methyltransferase [Christensenellales bacterium]|jgi:adenine-specific DNA-methyltransferase